jgi:hypothetical protein
VDAAQVEEAVEVGDRYRGEASQQPAALPQPVEGEMEDGDGGVEEADRRDGQDGHGQDVGPPPQDGPEEEAEEKAGQPESDLGRMKEAGRGVEAERAARHDAERAGDEEPAGAGEEPTDHRIRDEPDQVAQPEPPQEVKRGADEEGREGDRRQDGPARLVGGGGPVEPRGNRPRHEGNDGGEPVLGNRDRAGERAGDRRGAAENDGAEEGEGDAVGNPVGQVAAEDKCGERDADDGGHQGHDRAGDQRGDGRPMADFGTQGREAAAEGPEWGSADPARFWFDVHGTEGI